MPKYQRKIGGLVFSFFLIVASNIPARAAESGQGIAGIASIPGSSPTEKLDEHALETNGVWLHREPRPDLPKNKTELRKTIEKAEKGDIRSQYILGLYYRQPLDTDHMKMIAGDSDKTREGEIINGTPGTNKQHLPTYDETKPLIAKNWGLSVKWFQRAANQGWGPAQKALGDLYDIEGHTYDAAKAYYWTTLATQTAVHEGDELAKHRRLPKTLGSKLSPDKKGEIDKQLKEWKPIKENP